MNLILFLSYLLTISAIIATPGPSAMLMISHSIKNGKDVVLLNAAGSALAAAILIGIALLFIGKSIPNNVMPLLSLAGSLYLIYTGIRNVKRRSITTQSSEDMKEDNFFAQSFLTGISNPKDIFFFAIFMPQFLDTNIEFWQASTLLLIGWLVCDIFIMSIYGFMAAKAGKSLPANYVTRLTTGMGIIIIFAGTLLAYTSIITIISK